MAFSRTCSHMSITLSCTGEARTGHNVPTTASPVLSKKITSLNLQAMPCLMQPRRLLVFASRAHYCMLVNLFTGASRSFSPKLLSSQSAPVCAGVWDSPSRSAQALHFPLLNIIIESCFAISPICQGSSESTTWCTNHSSQFWIIYILSEGAL